MPKMSLSHALLTLAQTGPAAPSAGGNLMQVLFLVLLFGAMYFFMIAPQRKKQKDHEKMLAALQSGDEVVTTGGIYGTITNVKQDRFVVRVSDTTKVEVGKGFISSVLKRGDAEVAEQK
jgi:preprotein translocase subunit YajC